MSKRNVWTYKTPKSKKKKPAKNSVEAIKVLGEYYVEQILDHAVQTDGRIMYFLKWEGYGEEENSWEYEHQLNCSDVVDRFKLTVNGSHPPQYSWEEFDNFCHYLKRAVSQSFADKAVLRKLSDKSVSFRDLKNEKKLSDIKTKIQAKTEDLFTKVFDERQRNSQRLKAIELSKKVSKNLKIDENFGSIREFIEFMDKRGGIESKLKKWSEKMNAIIEKGGEGMPISVVNEVDYEVPVLYKYICGSIYDKKLFKKTRPVAEKAAIASCQCNNCFDQKDECCTAVIGFPMAYARKGVLSKATQHYVNVIFECNYNCKCGPDCPNRATQRGRQHRIELFRTDGDRGWGVRTLEAITKGTFISSYEGEVVSLNEANKRPTTYLFDLSASWDESSAEFSGEANDYTYVIDADKYGNITRFVNHSCDPNCRMIFVWNDNYDKLLPKVCMFTTRPIKPYEELTYDYGMQIINFDDHDYVQTSDTVSSDSGNASAETDSQVGEQTLSPNPPNPKRVPQENITQEKVDKVSFKQIECRCGADNCRKILYS